MEKVGRSCVRSRGFGSCKEQYLSTSESMSTAGYIDHFQTRFLHQAGYGAKSCFLGFGLDSCLACTPEETGAVETRTCSTSVLALSLRSENVFDSQNDPHTENHSSFAPFSHLTKSIDFKIHLTHDFF